MHAAKPSMNDACRTTIEWDKLTIQQSAHVGIGCRMESFRFIDTSSEFRLAQDAAMVLRTCVLLSETESSAAGTVAHSISAQFFGNMDAKVSLVNSIVSGPRKVCWTAVSPQCLGGCGPSPPLSRSSISPVAIHNCVR